MRTASSNGTSGSDRACIGRHGVVGMRFGSVGDDEYRRTTFGREDVLLARGLQQTDFRGCFPIETRDAARLRVGDCTAVRIPNYLEDRNTGKRVGLIKVLERSCRKPP